MLTKIKYELKRKYNAWLFKKYGFERGSLFENVPTIYKMNILWSPSEYARCENDEIAKCIEKGILDGEIFGKHHPIIFGADLSNDPETSIAKKNCSTCKHDPWIDYPCPYKNYCGKRHRFWEAKE